MEIRIDSFAAVKDISIDTPQSREEAITELLERIEHADNVGLDVFGIGEHHRKEFLDSAPSNYLFGWALAEHLNHLFVQACSGFHSWLQ